MDDLISRKALLEAIRDADFLEMIRVTKGMPILAWAKAWIWGWR